MRSLLATVEAFDRGVDVKDPRQHERRADALQDVTAHLVQAAVFLHALEAGAHHVLTNNALHTQQSGVDRVATHQVDVGVAPVAAQNAQQRRAHDVKAAAAAVAGVVQRAVGQEGLPALARLKELEKEHELALAAVGCLTGPFGIKPASRCVDGPTARLS